MQAYSIDTPEINLRDLCPSTPGLWSLAQRLKITRKGNPRHRRGNGSRRRSSYEHQLDRHLALLRACDSQSTSVKVRGRTTLYAWELLHAPLAQGSRAILAYRVTLTRLIAWCRENHPGRAGWALRQSRARLKREETATEYYLPRASWRAFYVWRRVVRIVERLLLTLHAWWPYLIPAPRLSSPRPEAEERRGEYGSDGEAGTGCRDQSRRAGGPVALRDLLPCTT
jgi:hypothetical protein